MRTRDDVIRMAREAGFSPPVSADGYMGLAYDDNLQRFADAAYAAGQAAEREAILSEVEDGILFDKRTEEVPTEIAAAIRARGEKGGEP